MSDDVGGVAENLTARGVAASGERKVILGLRRDIEELAGGGIEFE